MITCNLSFSSETYLIGCSAILVVFKVVAREVAVQVVPYQADTRLCLPACKREGWERGEEGGIFPCIKEKCLDV